MFTKFLSIFSKRNTRILILGTTCVLSSFFIGIKSVGEVQPVTLIKAGNIEVTGDVDGDGKISIQDAILILEIAQGYREATPLELKADPNGNGMLTTEDAIRILNTLQYR